MAVVVHSAHGGASNLISTAPTGGIKILDGAVYCRNTTVLSTSTGTAIMSKQGAKAVGIAALCWLAAITPAAAHAECGRGLIGHGGSGRLWVDDEGAGPVTVVFESGNGKDSTVWDAIAPRVRALGARTFAYDRAGLGRSDPAPATYTVEAELARLQRVLRMCRVRARSSSWPIAMAGYWA